MTSSSYPKVRKGLRIKNIYFLIVFFYELMIIFFQLLSLRIKIIFGDWGIKRISLSEEFQPPSWNITVNGLNRAFCPVTFRSGITAQLKYFYFVRNIIIFCYNNCGCLVSSFHKYVFCASGTTFTSSASVWDNFEYVWNRFQLFWLN